jgi:hypothetical protein
METNYFLNEQLQTSKESLCCTWFIDWLVGWLACWFAGWLFGWLV